MNDLDLTSDKDFEPIALVGIGCRLPGGIHGSGDFWHFLERNEQAFSDLSGERIHLIEKNKKFNQHLSKNLPRAAYLNDVEKFDEDFFKISPREAASMDPQQRLLLETSWETLEDAGWTLEELSNSRTGVFVGSMGCDYLSLHDENSVFNPFSPMGLDTSLLANRISYFLGLYGPSITVNTASSSSLAALHLAVNSLRLGESEKALVGGVNLIFNLRITDALLQMGAISPTGQANAFTLDADGYVRGEGIVCVALKTLTRALQDQDRIYCLILGSGVNNNGFNRGIASPSRNAQQQLLNDVYTRAKIAPAEVQYIEAHGSGTEAGDKAELAALSNYFGQRDESDSKLKVGTVKTNLGHLEAAAGITGLVKVALGLYHSRFPNSRFDGKSAIDDTDSRLSLISTLNDWKSGEKGRIAGVNSFGYGGTNCHVILGDLDSARTKFQFENIDGRSPSFADQSDAGSSDSQQKSRLIPISARSPEALIRFAAAAAEHLRDGSSSNNLKDWAYTTSQRRTHHFWRKAIIADSCQSLREQLSNFAETPIESLKLISEQPPSVVLWLNADNTKLNLRLIEMLRQETVFKRRFELAATLVENKFYYPLDKYFNQTTDFFAENRASVETILYWLQTVSLLELAMSAGLRFSGIIADGIGEIIAANLNGKTSDHETAEKIIDWSLKRAEMRKSDFENRMQKENYHWLAEPEHVGKENHFLIVTADELALTAENIAKQSHFLDLPYRITSLQNSGSSIEEGILKSLGDLYEKGAAIDWKNSFQGEETGKLIQLPFYQWQRKRHWLTNDTNSEVNEIYRSDDSIFTGNETAPHLKNGDTNSFSAPNDNSNAPIANAETKGTAGIFESFETEAEGQQIIEEYLRTLLANWLGRHKSEIDSNVSLLYLGVESLIVLELEYAIEVDCKVAISLRRQLGETNLTQLAELIVSQIIFLKKQKSDVVEESPTAEKVDWEIKRL